MNQWVSRSAVMSAKAQERDVVMRKPKHIFHLVIT